ncbi:glycerate kinase [Nocardioides coralli]|uniref:glycerate kinase n=1 Tax=Nocardioides coralli TaxID=2872154 RepID=UPI002016CE33|nr:glycerate kinase [Nocardioides coralli]
MLLAPDKFKGSMPASGVAHALGRGIRSVVPDTEVVALPVADGGDGTLDAALAAGFERVPATVSGPTGEPVATAWARQGRTAVVEMADACGLARLPGGVPAPLGASSRGLGELLAAALDAGCEEVVVGIGGSASTDGGAGMLEALGVRLLDAEGRVLPPGGEALSTVARADLSGLHPRVGAARFVIACDVDNPLLGDAGAATVYGPQKGATPADVELLDSALGRFAEVVAAELGRDLRDQPGAGAAGGVGFAAVSVLGARLRPGIDLMLDLLGFDEALAGSTLVVTGEGSLDEQSLHGKAPVGVARRARRAAVPVVAVCGRRSLDESVLRSVHIASSYALLDLEPDAQRCIDDPEPLLTRLGEQIARAYLHPC